VFRTRIGCGIRIALALPGFGCARPAGFSSTIDVIATPSPARERAKGEGDEMIRLHAQSGVC
jgi:hypothetical protein